VRDAEDRIHRPLSVCAAPGETLQLAINVDLVRATSPFMSFKAVLKTIGFLILFFVMLYVGVNNTDTITFSFPVGSKEKIRATAALIYFGVFAVGVLAGTMLHTSGGGGKKSGGKEK
jgi:hypothetical protein